MKSLFTYITEAKHNKYINLEIKTDDFAVGDIVLFRELLEKGDQDAIMVVVENRSPRVLISDVGTTIILGSTHVFNEDELFKVGHVEPKDKIIDEREIFDICKELGIHIPSNTIPRKIRLR